MISDRKNIIHHAFRRGNERGKGANMDDFTRKFDVVGNKVEIREIMSSVYDALKVKGYNPVSQIVGYILSEDPTYITNYNNARSLICRIDRDELLQELVINYLEKGTKDSN